MTKITKEMVQQAYLTARRVWEEQESRYAASMEIHRLTGMGTGSAGDYITVFLAMMEGKVYKRTVNLYATEFFLVKIGEDYGIEAQQRAAQAVKAHVAYYRQVHGYLAKTDQLADRFLN